MIGRSNSTRAPLGQPPIQAVLDWSTNVFLLLFFFGRIINDKMHLWLFEATSYWQTLLVALLGFGVILIPLWWVKSDNTNVSRFSPYSTCCDVDIGKQLDKTMNHGSSHVTPPHSYPFGDQINYKQISFLFMKSCPGMRAFRRLHHKVDGQVAKHRYLCTWKITHYKNNCQINKLNRRKTLFLHKYIRRLFE